MLVNQKIIRISDTQLECLNCGRVYTVKADPNKFACVCNGKVVSCIFDDKPWADGLYHCKNCGRASDGYIDEESAKHLRCSYSGAPPVAPNIVRKALNLSKAYIQHKVNGSPTCTQEQIDERFAICISCNWYNGTVCTHKNCGCDITNEDKYLSKLAWADQRCPIGKWIESKQQTDAITQT